MTQEEKHLLLIDLCARLSHGVICFAPDYEYGDIGKLWCIDPFEDLDPPITIQYPKGNTITKFCSEVKPYLRPMSSMTEEEINEFILISDTVIWLGDKRSTCILSLKQMDWLNKKMFDYRGLIPMGLALEAKKEMYKTK